MEYVERQDKRHNNKAPWLANYRWKPGQSGNPKGGPRGKTLKTWAREFLAELPDELKLDFLKHMPADIVWRMAEGNPDTSVDHSGGMDFTIKIDDGNNTVETPQESKPNPQG